MEPPNHCDKTYAGDNACSLWAAVKNHSSVSVSLLSLTSACVLWFVGFHHVDLREMTDLGLVSVFPPAAYVALVVLTASFCLTLHRRRAPTWILFLHVVVFIVLIHATPNLLYGTLRYAWAWKHVGIVDYIQRHGSIDPGISRLGAYHNWPGFFALNAVIVENAGLESALVYAGWGPLFFNLLNVGALLLVLSTFSRDRRLVWLGIWFFFLTNWVGQDYFSPQAVTYFLYLVVVGISLRWFRSTSLPSRDAVRRWVPLGSAASQLHRMLMRANTTTVRTSESTPMARVGLLLMVVVILVAIASSHQLTPFLTISALTALVIFQVVSARSLPVLMTVLTISWVMYVAVAFMNNNLYWVVQSIGRLLDNFGANLIELSEASPGQVFVAQVDRGLSILVWALAFLGGIRRLKLGHWDVAAALLVVAPLPLAASNSYGGEMIFRVYLYCLPFTAFFGAAVLYPSSSSGRSWRTVASAMVLSWTLLAGFLVGYYGKERQNYFTPEEVEAAEYIHNTVAEGSLLLDGTSLWPKQYKNYEFYDYYSLEWMPRAEYSELLDDPASTISDLMRGYPDGHFVTTRSQKSGADMTGILPAGSLEKIERALDESPDFELAYESQDARVFVLTDLHRSLW